MTRIYIRLATLGVILSPAATVRAALFNVSNVPELIAAIDSANQNAESDSITLAAGTNFTLTEVNNSASGPTGLPIIATGHGLSILGNGSIIERSTDTGTPAFRLFDVAAGASLALENLTLQGGRAFDFANYLKNVGGAIHNAGDVTLRRVTVQHNVAEGRQGASCIRCDRHTIGGPGWWAHGGGIYSTGSLLVENSTLFENNAIGGRGGFASAGGGRGGDGRGGGLYAAAGTATLLGSVVTGNDARRGAGGAGYRGSPAGLPGQGFGGGIYITNDAQLGLDDFTLAQLTNNTASTSNPNIFGQYTIISNPTPLQGDYNNDGTVDAADYVVWRKTDGTQARYEIWRAHFGQAAGSDTSAAATAAVPEPSAQIMFVVAMIAYSITNSRPRHKLTHR